MRLQGSKLIRLCTLTTIFAILLPMLAAGKSVSFWTQEAFRPELAELLGEFTQETGIEVELMHIGYGLEDILVAMIAGTPPDLFSHGAAALGAFGASGLLMPLDEHVAGWEVLDDMVPVARQSGVYEGVQLALPWLGVIVRDLAYRTDLFEEAGLSAPPVTWDDLLRDGRKLTRLDVDGRITRSALTLPTTMYGAQQVFGMFLNQSGGALIMDGRSGLSDPAALQGLEFYVDLVNHSGIHGPGSLLLGSTAMEWAAADSIMQLRQLQSLVDSAQFIHMATFPYSQQPAAFLAADWAAIPRAASNPEGALELLAFLLRPENQSRLNLAMGSIPFYTEAYDWDWVRSSQAITHLMSATLYGVGNPAHEHWFEIRAILFDTVERALRLEQPAASLLSEADRLINQVLEQ